MNYLDFVEDYKNEQTVNLFEKVLIAASRAKDLYEGKTSIYDLEDEHKPTAIALFELNNHAIQPKIEDKSPDEPVFDDDDDEEEDD